MMTPGDFASLQEGREGLSTEDYVAWKLPYVWVHSYFRQSLTIDFCREEEDPDEYPFPLNLRIKKPAGEPLSPAEPAILNGGRSA